MKERPRKDRFGNNAWLREWVGKPALRVTLEQLPELWRTTEIHFRCERPDGMEPGPWMARSFRGAVGRVLKSWHEAHRRCDYPARAFEAFYQSHGMIDSNHIPTPIGWHVACVGKELRIRMTLYGDACLWRYDLIEAVNLALASGIGLRENGRLLRPWQPRDWFWNQRARCNPREWSDKALISTLSPFKPGSSELFSGDFVTSLAGLAQRIRGMARWSGIDLVLGAAELTEAIAKLQIKDLGNGPAIAGFLKRANFGDEVVVGVEADFELEKIDKQLWPLLLIGEDLGVGGHRAYGFGQYRCLSVGRTAGTTRGAD